MIVQQFAEVHKLHDQLRHELNVVTSALQQQTATHHVAFMFESPYPPAQPIVSGVAALMYKYSVLRCLWSSYASTIPLRTWMDCKVHHCYLFFVHLRDLVPAHYGCVLRHVSQCPNPNLHAMNRPYSVRPRQARTHTSDTVWLWRHYKRLVSASRIALATNIEIDAIVTDPTLLQAKHSCDPGTTAFGGWYSLPQYAAKTGGCNAIYAPRSYERLVRNGSRVLSGILTSLLQPTPCRILLAIPLLYLRATQTWRELDKFSTHTLATGVIPTNRYEVRIYLVSNAQACDHWPISNALLVAHLGPILRAMHMPIHHLPTHMRVHIPTLPQQTPCFTGCATDRPLHPHESGRDVFWRVWHAEQRTRDTLLQRTPIPWSELLQSYRRTNAIMPYAPQTHLRRLCRLIDWTTSDLLDVKGQWVYMVWTVLDPRPYFGQCGAISGPRAIIQRFSEEILAARSCNTVYGRTRQKMPLYIHLLKKLGLSSFCVIPVKRTTVCNTDHTAIWHIRHSVPNMNTSHTKRKQYYRWLARGNIRHCLPAVDINSEKLWRHYSQVKRVALQPLDALRMLVTAKKGMGPGPYRALQQKLIPFVKHTTGLALPYTLTLPVQTAERTVRGKVRKLLQDDMRKQCVPAPLRAYYPAILTVPVTTGRTVKSVLTENRVDLSLEAMSQIIEEGTGCGCVQPSVCTHTTLYGAQEIQTQIPEQYHDLIQLPTNAKVEPSVSRVYRNMHTYTTTLYRKMPAMQPAHNTQLAHTLARLILSCRKQRVRNPGTDPPITRHRLRDMRASLPNMRWIF